MALLGDVASVGFGLWDLWRQYRAKTHGHQDDGPNNAIETVFFEFVENGWDGARMILGRARR